MKLTLNDLANLSDDNSVVSLINNNNQLIEEALENTLSRDGTLPNTMAANLDMNSFRIVNLPAPAGNTDAVNKEYIDNILQTISGGEGGIVLPGGSNSDIQFNDAGTFGGDSSLQRVNSGGVRGLKVAFESPKIILKDTLGDSQWEFTSQTSEFGGVNDTTFGFSYNIDESDLTHPVWNEGTEPHYVDGAPPLGVLEKHWTYTSIDRLTKYRVFQWDINLNTHKATELNILGEFQLQGYADFVAENGFYTFRVVDDPLGSTFTTKLNVDLSARPAQSGTIFGVIGETDSDFMGLEAIDLTEGSAVLGMVAQTTSATQIGIKFNGNTSSDLVAIQAVNGGAGDTYIRMDSNADCYTVYHSSSDWAIGNDSGTLRFAKTNRLDQESDRRFALDTYGNASFAGSMGLASPEIKTGTSYSMAADDSSLIFNASGPFTLTLQSAATYPGRILWVKNIAAQTLDSASSNVKPLGSDTAGTSILSGSAGKWAMLQSDGTDWIVMAGVV